MASLNAAANLNIANNFASDWAGALLRVYNNTTLLAEHSVPSWTTANVGDAATASAAAIADDTILDTATANKVLLVSGAEEIELDIGTEVTLSTTNYIAGETSSVNGGAANGVVITFPA